MESPMLPHHTFFRFLGTVAAIVLVGARTDDLEAHKISGECFLKGTYMEIGIHATGSYGTVRAPPSSFNYKTGSRGWPYGLGFTADHGRDGYNVGTPKFSGDYFVPGSPVEGWGVSWRTGSASGTKKTRMMKGLVGMNQFTGSTEIDCFTSGTRATSTWTGTTDGALQLQQTTSFNADDLYFTTSITIKNTMSVAMHELYYMRTVDPDQEQPHSGDFTTNNWVQYQPVRDGDPAGYEHPTSPHTALVTAVGRRYPDLVLGLGTVHPDSRVNHFGFNNNDPAAAWNENGWKSFSEASPRTRDEAVNLMFKFPPIDPGATVSFNWVYVLDENDLQKATVGIESVQILQPTETASGIVLFAASIVNTVTSVSFAIRTTAGVDQHTATASGVPDYVQSNGNFVYSVLVDTTTFETGVGTYVFEVSGTESGVDGRTFTTNSLVEVRNNGPRLEWVSHPVDGTATFKNYEPNVLRVKQAASTSFSISSVTFFREVAGSSINLGTGVASGSGASRTWSINLEVSDLVVYTPMAVKAVAVSGSVSGSAVAPGKVVELNFPPTGVGLSPKTVDENKPAGTLVGTLSAADPNVFDSHSFTLTAGGASLEVLSGNLLVTKMPLDHEVSASIPVTITATDSEGASVSQSFSVTVNDVNDPPSDILLTNTIIAENSAIGSTIGFLSAVDQDAGDVHFFGVLGSSGGVSVSGGNRLIVSAVPNHESTPTIDVTVQAQDSAGTVFSKTFTITITDVNEPPSNIIVTSLASPWETDPPGTHVVDIEVVDQDAGASYTFSSSVVPIDVFSFVSPTARTVSMETAAALNFEATAFYDVEITASDTASSHSISTTFRVNVQDIGEPPAFTQPAYYCNVPENSPAETLVCSVGASHAKATIDLTYNITSGNEDGLFFLHPCSGNLFVTDKSPGLNHEAVASYTIEIEVSAEDLEAASTIYVTVKDVAEPPSFSIPSSLTASEVATVGTAISSPIITSDEDAGDSATFSLSGAAGSGFEIDAVTGVISVAGPLDFELQPVVTLLVVAEDSTGLTDSESTTVSITDANEPPVIYAQPGFVAENSPVGTTFGLPLQALDQDAGQTTTLAIIGAESSRFSIEPGTNLLRTEEELNFEDSEAHSVTIQATDSGSPALSTTSTVAVTVQDRNDKPTLASMSGSVLENSPAGTVIMNFLPHADDEDGDELTFSPVGPCPFSITPSGQAVVQTPPNFERDPSHSCLVSVTDGVATAQNTLSISVGDVNEPPTSLGATAFSIHENSDPGTFVGVLDQSSNFITTNMSFFDPEGAALDFSIPEGSSTFELLPTRETSTSWNLALRVSDPAALDYETLLAAGPPVIRLNVSVSDGTNSVRQEVVVSVLDVNEAPSMTGATFLQEEKVSTPFLLSADAYWQDPDTTTAFRPPASGGSPTFQITSQDSGDWLVLDPTTGVLRIDPAKASEAAYDNAELPTHTISAQITISDGELTSAPETFTLELTNVNHAPSISLGSTAAVAENAAAGAEVAQLTVSDTDAGDTVNVQLLADAENAGVNGNPLFAAHLGAGGAVSVQLIAANRLDYEHKSAHKLTLVATDSPVEASVPALSSSISFTVSVEDVPEPPQWVAASLPPLNFFSMFENSASGTAVFPVDDGPPGVQATDEDGDGVSYTLGPAAPATFELDPSTGVFALAPGGSLDFETLRAAQCPPASKTCIPTIDVAVRATDNSSAALFVEGVATIRVLDRNEPPTLSQPETPSLPEDANVGTRFSSGVVVTDVDSSNFTFTLTGSTALGVDSASGQLIVAENLDWETVDVLTAVLTVSDHGSTFDSVPREASLPISVSVANVHDVAIVAVTSEGTLPTRGSSVPNIRITGSNMGYSAGASPTRPPLRVRVSLVSDALTFVLHDSTAEPTDACTFTSNTQINCKSPPGAGKGLRVLVESGLHTARSSTTLRYSPPVVTGVTDPSRGRALSETAWPTQGGSSILLTGEQLPSADLLAADPSAVSITYGPPAAPAKYMAQACSVQVDFESILCQTAPGVGTNMTFTATVMGQLSPPLNLPSTGYALPQIDSATTTVSPMPVLPVAGASILVEGANFGPPSEAALMAAQLQSPHSDFTVDVHCSHSPTTPHTQLVCPIPAGVGSNLTLELNVGAQQATFGASGPGLSYEKPELLSISGPGSKRASTIGGERVLILGRHFGVPAVANTASIQVRYGADASLPFIAEDCTVLSDTSMACLTGPGTGTDHAWETTIEGGTSNLAAFGTSYQWPTVTTFDGPGADMADTRGGEVVNITGANFGSASRNAIDVVTYGLNGTEYIAEDCHVSVSHTRITCRSAPGIGRSHNWKVFIDGQESRAPSTNYAPPSVLGFEPASPLPVTGGAHFLILGLNFGSEAAGASLERVTHGPATGMEYDLTDQCTLLNDTHISCITVASVGGDHKLFITVGSQTNEGGPPLQFAGPTISSMTWTAGASIGRGASWNNAQDAALVSGPTSGYSPAGHAVIVRVVGQHLSVEDKHSAIFMQVFGAHDAASFLAVPDLSSDGEYASGISGFAAASGPAVSSNATGLDSVEFHLPAGHGITDRFVRLGVAHVGLGSRGLASLSPSVVASASLSVPMPFQYALPELGTISLANEQEVCAGLGGRVNRLTLFGSNLGTSLSSFKVMIEPSGGSFASCSGAPLPPPPATMHACTATSWIQEHAIVECRTNVNEGFAHLQFEQFNGTHTVVVNTRTVFFKQANPVIAAMTCSGCEDGEYPTRGGANITITGEDLAEPLSGEVVNVTIAGRACDILEAAPNSITCVVPAGQGRGHIPIVRRGEQVSNTNPSTVINYMKPSIHAVEVRPAGGGAPTHLTLNPADLQSRGVVSSLACGDTRVADMPAVELPAEGGRLILQGDNFGTDPVVSLGLLSATRAYATHIDAANSNHTHLEVVFSGGMGTGQLDPLACFSSPASERDVLGGGSPTKASQTPAWQLFIADSSLPIMLDVGTAWFNFHTPLRVSFPAPIVQGIVPASLPTQGGSLVLTGKNLGCDAAVSCGADYQVSRSLTPRVLLRNGAGTSMPCVVDSFSATTIACTVPAGVGTGWSVIVGVDNHITEESNFFAYSPPQITTISPAGVPTSGLKRDGSPMLMTVTGSNFGATQGSLVLSRDGATIPVDPATVVSWNHTAFTMQAPEGNGYPVHVVAIVGGQQSGATLGSRVVYLPPHVETVAHAVYGPRECEPRPRRISINPLHAAYFDVGANQSFIRFQPAECFPTMGDFPIVISGRSFGHAAGGTAVQVTVNGLPCAVDPQTPEHHQHDRIQCMAPMGMGVDLPVQVRVANRSSALHENATLSYDAPVVDSIMPNQPNARGDEIIVNGKNFGFVKSAVNISVGGVACTSSEWLNDGAVSCAFEEQVAGPKNITILAGANLPVTLQDWEMRVVAQCAVGEYGLWGEVCLPCPQGAECPGGETVSDLTYAADGFYKLEVANSSSYCPAQRRQKPTCAYFAPCEPSWACTGNNECATGYEGIRCSQCLAGEYYRIGGQCQKCPDQQWLLIVGLCVAALLVGVMGYYLNRKKVRLGVFTVVVDYFQVVAMFGRTRVTWPPAVVAIFNALSAFSLNIEITAPECAVPDVTVGMKLNFTLALPLVAAVLIFAGGLLNSVVVSLSQRKCGRTVCEASLRQCINPFITMLYFMYLLVARQALDVFNCAPTVPPDGKTYMSGMTDIVCWAAGGEHMTMVPVAAAAIGLYVVMFPAAVATLLMRNRDLIRVDQLAKAMGIKPQRLNDKVVQFSSQFSRLYWLFNPTVAHFWIIMILIRKFSIAIAALMFRTTPSFMMAVCLLVLFGAFVLQSRFTPYMGRGQFMQVRSDFRTALRMKSPMAMRLDAALSAAMKTASSSSNGQKAGQAMSFAHAQVIKRKTANKSKALLGGGASSEELCEEYAVLMDLNFIETTLLGCAILVNLMGMMFLSSRFSEELVSYYMAEYNTLGFTTMFILGASVLLACFMLFMDILGVVSPRLANRIAKAVLCRRCRRAAQRAASRFSIAQTSTKTLGLQVNPMTQGKGAASVFAAQMVEDKDLLIAQLQNPGHPNVAQYKEIAEAAVTHLLGETRDASAKRRLVSMAKPVKMKGGIRRKRQEFTQAATRALSTSSGTSQGAGTGVPPA